MSDAPLVGSMALDFAVPPTENRLVRLDDYVGRWLVVFFYPKAFTPGCTKEAGAFTAQSHAIEALSASVLGVSVDDLAVQCAFAREQHLGFALLADVDQPMLKAWGVSRGLLPFDERVTFIVDPDGVARARFHHEVQATRHVDDVLAFLRAQVPGPASSSP
ncbi:MAG: peroxiredoxin [Deltaproteobacteria bacterium]|nr:peroxiredoxin [Deltaproteobacteria bacterium]